MRDPQLGRRIDELLDFLDLRSHADVPVEELSGGFQRRLAIAMSLMNRPELLILDEPTTGLDPAVRLALWSRVRELRASGTTVLLTTHYMEEAERLCDRVVIMSHGRMVMEGSPRELIEGKLARQALELDCTPEEERELFGELEDRFAHLRSDGRLILYADDVAPLVEDLRARDRGEDRALVVRPANLEDVFLATTGTLLWEDE
jgi:lipooligosaccharide transport system ATP-binding protein